MADTFQLAIIVNGEADGVVELGDDITAIGSSAQGAESSVRGFFDGINQGAGGVSNVAAQMAGLDTAIGSAAQAWNAGEVASQSFASALDANIDGINAVGRMLGQLSTAINDTTPAPVVDAFNQLNTTYGAHNAALQETFTDWNKVNAAMADIRTSVGTLDQALAQTGQAAGNAGQGIGALDQSLGTVNQATTHAAQGFAGFAQSLGTAVDGGVARVKSGIAGLEQVVSATAQPFAGLGQAIGSGLSTATQKVSGFAQSIGSSIGGGLSTAAQSVTGWAQSVGSSITSGLSSIPNQLANVGGQIKGFFTGLLSNAANIKAGIDMFAGLGGAVIGVGQSLIAGSAEFEGYEARFASLMGSTDAAKDKIQELSTFASTTPFELPDVIKASQSLQVFGGSALNTKENLAVVGNAAAATSQNIGDVSFWFARAYSAIQNGQPFGEAAQNLQQMGVMSGDTVVKLDALKNSGASNQQVWEAFAGSLNAPTDAMAKMGGTWTGLTSTMSDSWSLLVRTFGQPLFDELKPQLQGVIDQMSSSGLIDAVGQLGTAFASVLAPAISFVAGTVIPGVVAAIQFIAPAVSEAINILSQVGAIFGELAGQAMGWGQNIINQLAGGMMDAANVVMSVLQSIGGMIANLLMPGSPPKLLPELDTWGAGAMSAYLEGWGQADFGVFNSISDSIKGALDGIAKASGDKGMNIASIMLGSQDDIAKAINEVHQFGKVSEETFNGLISAIGPAGSEVSGLVSAYLDLQAATQNVASAQQELNSVTDEYAAKLSPLNAQLKGIQNQKQAIQDQKKLAELQAKLADQSLSDADRQMAMLEQQEIMTRQQIRTTEAERDVAVDAAKQKLDAAKQEQAQAKARVDQQKALFDQQNKTNALIADQAKAMASVGGAMAGAASATKPLADAVQGVNQTLGAARQSISDVRTNLATMGTTIQSVVAPPMEWLKGAITGLMGAAAGIAVVLGAPVVWSALGTALGVVGTALAAVGSAVAFVLSPFGLLLIAAAALGAAITTNFMGIGTLAQNLMGIFAQFGTVISAAFAAFQSGGLTAALSTFGSGLASIGAQLVAWGAQAGTVLLNIGQAFINWITPLIPVALAQLQSWGVAIVNWIVTQGPILLAQFLTWGAALISWIAPYIPMALAALGGVIASVGGWIAAQVPALLAQFLTWGQALIAWIAPMIPPALAALGGLIGAFLGWAGGQLGALLSAFGAWAAPLIAWIPGAITSFLAQWPAMLSGWLDTFASWAGPLLAQLATLGASIIAWVATQAGPLLAQLAVWGVQFVAWIVPMIPQVVAGLLGLAGAIVVFIAQTAGVILAKVVEWGAAMLGWVAKEVLPKLPGVLKGVLESILGWVQSAASSLGSEAASIGRNIVQGIISGVGAAAGALTSKLREMASSALDAAKRALGIASPSKVFAQQVGVQIPAGMAVGITTGMPAVNKSLVSGIAGLSESAAKALESGSQAIAAANAYGGGAGLGAFLADFTQLAVQFNAAAVALGGQILGTATRFADTIGKMSEPISKAVAALQGLNDLVTPSVGAISAFTATLAVLLSMLTATATSMDVRGLAAAVQFADAAGKILAVVKTGVDAFAALNTYVQPVPGQVTAFTGKLSWLIQQFVQAGAWLQGAGLAAGVALAAAADKILAVVKTGVESFAALNTYVQPVPGQVTAFTGKLAWLIQQFVQAGGWLQGAGLAAGVALAAAADKILAVVKTGVESFAALNTYVQPVPGQVTAFTGKLAWLIQQFVQAGAWLRGPGLAAGVALADAAGKILAVIGSGVEAFAKLTTFAPIPTAAITAFGQALQASLVALVAIATSWAQAAIDRAAVFAEGAGKTIAIIGGGVDGFIKLATFQGVPETAISAFGQALNAALTVIEYISAQWIQAFVDRAAVFAEGAGKAVGIIGSAVDGFLKLVAFQGVPEAAFAAFGQALTRALTVIDAMSADWASIGLDRAVAWAGAVDAIVKTITAAVDAIGKLGQLQNGAAGLLDTFSVTLNGILTEMQRQILPATTISGENMVIGLINGILSQRSALVTAMVNTVMAAVIAARQTLGIASPSKVFEQIGQYAGAGLQGGMAAMQPAIAATSAGLGISAVNATTSALRPSSGGTTNNNQRSVVIEAGAIVINGAGGNPRATADAVATELQRRIGMQGT